MSRATIRQALITALTEVGAVVPPGTTAEVLVRSACTWMTSTDRTTRALLGRQEEARQVARRVLSRAGKDPGAHAPLVEMLNEIERLMAGRPVR